MLLVCVCVCVCAYGFELRDAGDVDEEADEVAANHSTFRKLNYVRRVAM